MDDFEIEITPLEGPEVGSAPELARSAPLPARSPFAPHLSRRGKLIRLGTTTGVVLLAVILIAASSPALRGALNGFVRGGVATGQVAAPPGSETVYFEHAVPWGLLSIDGKRVPSPTDSATDSVTLAPGRHAIQYIAPPFAGLNCQLRVPITTQDTCPLEFAPPAPSAASQIYVRVVDLGGTPDRLTAPQAAALAGVLDAALRPLDSRTLLPAGSAYLGINGQPVITKKLLVATLTFRLNSDLHVVEPYLPGGFLCSQICYLGASYPVDGTGAGGGWGILALAHVTWTYAQPQGATVLRDAPTSPLPDGSIALISVGVMWDGAWHAVAVPGENQFGMSPICEIANDQLPPSPSTGTSLDTSFHTEVPTATPAEGCLLSIQAAHGNASGTSALVLYRFGILYAANKEAHILYPGLPLATPADAALAENIAMGEPVG